MVLHTSLAHAAVTISEVAWMGSSDSHADEWIELYNDGDAVSLDGWTLTDGSDLSIALSGTIDGGGYAVLERTDDTSASGSAFMIYTGALANSGATLTLTRADGGTEDQVAGGEDWEHIGGDNTTKETAQYTQSGWTTGTPTPGRSNVAYAPKDNADDSDNTDDTDDDAQDDASDDQADSDTSDTDGDGGQNTIPLTPERANLILSLRAPTRAYVHQPVTFSVAASGVGKPIRNSLRHTWNFGDLTTGSGTEVTHQYDHAGTYVVVVHAAYAGYEATTRHQITVLPTTFSLTTNADGDLQVHNDARYEIDLSQYAVRGEDTVVFPAHSILLPNATVTIPRDRIGDGHAFLLDQEHAIVASTMPAREEQVADARARAQHQRAAQATASPAPRAPGNTTQPPSDTFAFSGRRPTSTGATEPTPTTTPEHPDRSVVRASSSQTAALGDAGLPISSDTLPYLGLIGLLSLGLLAVYQGKKK